MSKLPLVQPVPDPIPHIPFFPPFQEYCLTDHLPTDVDHLPRIINQPQVMADYGYDHPEMTRDLVEEWNVRMAHLNKHWPYCVIRKVEWLSAPSPGYIGMFDIGLDEFRMLGEKKAETMRREKDGRVGEDAQYMARYFIDEAYAGKGLTTAAGQAAIAAHPYIRNHPGQLTAGYLVGNIPSQRVQEKLGFRARAKVEKIYKGRDAVSMVWVAERDCSKEESIFRDLADL